MSEGSEKKHRVKRGIAGDQAADGLFRKLVRHHYFGPHEPTAELFCNQSLTVKAVIDAVDIDDLAAFAPMHHTLDDDN